MGIPGRAFGAGLLLILTVSAAVARSGVPEIQLVLSVKEPDRILACLPLEHGVEFSLEFINSIYLAPVKETFIYTQSEGVVLIRVESPSAGVFEYYGLTPDKPGAANLHRIIENIVIRSHDYQHHRLTVKGRGLSFKGLVPDGEAINVSVQTGKHLPLRPSPEEAPSKP